MCIGFKKAPVDILFFEAGDTSGAVLEESEFQFFCGQPAGFVCKEWRDIFKKYNDPNNAARYKISEDAFINDKELFAESFVMYNREKQNLPTDIKNFIKDLLNEQ